MHILDLAEHIGFLAVARSTTGEVMISTDPPVFLSNNAPRVLADNKADVTKIIRSTNLRTLVDSRQVIVLSAT